MTTDEKRFELDDPRSHHTAVEQAAWVRFVAAAMLRADINGAEAAGECADTLVLELRKRDRTHDGEV